MFKVTNKETRTKPCERGSGVFTVNVDDFSHLVLVLLLLTVA